MKPAWDKLMEEFKDSKTIFVGDSDCTADGKALCADVGVKGYPTIKYGDLASLEAYSGGRDFDALKKFAQELKPSCSPANIDLCDDAKKKEIEAMNALSDADLDSKIEAKEKEAADAEASFKAEVEKLQAQYQKLSKEKDAAVEAVKASGLGLLKAVKAGRKKKQPNEEL